MRRIQVCTFSTSLFRCKCRIAELALGLAHACAGMRQAIKHPRQCALQPVEKDFASNLTEPCLLRSRQIVPGATHLSTIVSLSMGCVADLRELDIMQSPS
jgi:hypothetical protein